MHIISVHGTETIIKFGQKLQELRQKVTGVRLIMPHGAYPY